MKKLKYFSILLLCSLHCLLLSGCSFQKKEEIIWYISNPHFFHIEDAVPYEDLSSERFDLFNKQDGRIGHSCKGYFSVSAGYGYVF